MQEPTLLVWLARNGPALLVLLVVALTTAGCVTNAESGWGRPPQSDLSAQIREVDLSPRFPRQHASVNVSEDSAKATVYYGDETLSPANAAANPRARGQQADPLTTGALPEAGQAVAEKGYEMNFENAPIATVAKAVLSDILGLGYTIDPRVQGSVSLSSGRPIPRKDLLYVFESALRVSNVALVREGRSYRLVPSAEAVGTGAIDRGQSLEAGFGISVVPLQYVSAQTLMKLLDNFAAKQGMVRAEPSRNLVIIQGNGADRQAAIDTVLSFDADWMRDQSVGIYPIRNSTPEPVILELERIVDAGEGGLSQNVVKLQAINRQNAILVVSRKPEYLKTVSTWIARLDRAGGSATGVKVYRMRYGDARQVAMLLNDIFLGNSGGGTDSPTNQLAPGSGVVSASSDRSNSPPTQQTSGNPVRVASGSGLSASTNFDTRFGDPVGLRPTTSATSQASTYGRNGPGPLLANVRIAPDIVNNALLIYASPENYRIIERTVQQLDQPQLQVAIDATIAEITLNDDLRYGVQFFLKSKDIGLPNDSGSMLNTAGNAVLSRILPGFNFLVGTEAQPRVILDALHSVTDVKILSTPSVVVVDNQFASLLVGDQIPITTRTAQSVDVPTAPVVNNIDYRNTGVILRVAPRINANGNVLLDVEQEISAVADTSTADTLTPTISQRKVKSSIAVASGQTVLLGGLISERQDRGRKGIPGLDQIPGVADLLSRSSGSMQRTELIIFIRPQIIRNGIDAHRVAGELRAKMRGVFGAEMSPQSHPNAKQSRRNQE